MFFKSVKQSDSTQNYFSEKITKILWNHPVIKNTHNQWRRKVLQSGWADLYFLLNFFFGGLFWRHCTQQKWMYFSNKINVLILWHKINIGLFLAFYCTSVTSYHFHLGKNRTMIWRIHPAKKMLKLVWNIHFSTLWKCSFSVLINLHQKLGLLASKFVRINHRVENQLASVFDV